MSTYCLRNVYLMYAITDNLTPEYVNLLSALCIQYVYNMFTVYIMYALC